MVLVMPRWPAWASTQAAGNPIKPRPTLQNFMGMQTACRSTTNPLFLLNQPDLLISA
jgi:hypothetical protein